jgi:hypothetical protein
MQLTSAVDSKEAEYLAGLNKQEVQLDAMH